MMKFWVDDFESLKLIVSNFMKFDGKWNSLGRKFAATAIYVLPGGKKEVPSD